MGKASRDKGKRGEREFAALCREHGYDVRRTSQYCGRTGDASDCVGLHGIHIEVKRTEKLSLYDAVDQAKRDSGGAAMPVVFHRRNNCEWLAIMPADAFFTLYREWEAGRGNDAV